MAKKTISNTFTVNTVEDGESAPYYFQEWFAWSNDASTSSVTTPPTISGSWETSIPAQGSYAYLWRKSIRYVWNENMRRYSEETAQYFRMSGTNGTSIKTKGTIKVAITASGTFPTAGFSSGDLGIKQGDSYMWQFNGSSWSHVSSASSDGDSYTMTKDCTIDLEGDGTSENIKGHLIQWSTEASKWIDLGQFKGENGKTYYTHVAWATKVNYNSSGKVTSVEGFTPDKSPNDTTHLWMGVRVNESSGADPSDATDYTWSYTKGVQGNDAVQYYIKTDIDNVVVPSDRQSIDLSSTPKAYFKKITGSEEAAQTMYYATYWRSGSALTSRSSGQASQINLATTYNSIYDSLVIFAKVDSAPTTTDFDCKKEIIVQKRGNTGGRGKIGRFFYFGGTFNAADTTQTFIVNDAQAPYFEHSETVTTQSGTKTVKRYHVFNYDTNGTYTMAQMWAIRNNWNYKPWEVMTNDFKYIITQALFAAYAHLGSFIINDDWMISQHGTINGQASTNYTQFDPDHPNDNTGTNFIPNFAVDGLTGKTYQNDAHVKGEIVSASGNIGGFTINSKWLGNLGGTNDQQGWTYITKDGSGHFFNKKETNPWALRAYGEIELVGNGLPVVIANISGSYIMINGRLQIVEDMLRNTEAGDVYVDTLGLLHVRGNVRGPYFVTDEFGRVTNPSTAYTQDGFRQINVVRGNCTLPNGCPVGTVYYVKGTGSTTVTVTNGSNDWIEGWDDNDNKGNSVGIQSNSVQFVKTATHIWTMFVGI